MPFVAVLARLFLVKQFHTLGMALGMTSFDEWSPLPATIAYRRAFVDGVKGGDNIERITKLHASCPLPPVGHYTG
jgi:hypothetical protein